MLSTLHDSSGVYQKQPKPSLIPASRMENLSSISHDETVRSGGYCSASGEMLRPLQDQQQRRHSARACLSIKNESVGSEDDQTPS